MFNTHGPAAQKKQNNATTKDGSFFCPYLFLSSLTPDSIKRELEKEFVLCPLPSFEKLAAPVSCHPDMLIFKSGEHIIIHSDYYAKNPDIFARHESRIILSSEAIGNRYPNDVLFNALPLGKYVFCKESSVSRLIKAYVERTALTTVNTRQGYARCSVCKISEGAVISSDASLLAAIAEKGIDTLCISEGGVRLEPYDHGFIGGASGAFGDDVFFCGSIELHPDAERIKDFCKKHKKNAVSLSDEELFDVGTLFFFESSK